MASTRAEWYEKPPAIISGLLALIVLVGFLGFELILHLRDILNGGVAPCIEAFWKGFTAFSALLVGAVGPVAASGIILSCIVIPVTTVSIYTIFRKVKEKPKALIVAISLFLDPLFIDFFKDEIGKEDALKKLLIDAFGVVTFLAASYFWNRATGEKAEEKKKSERILARAAAIILFLLPTLGMIGYLAAETNGNWDEFITHLTPQNCVGLTGLLAVALVGIGLSRYYEGP